MQFHTCIHACVYIPVYTYPRIHDPVYQYPFVSLLGTCQMHVEQWAWSTTIWHLAGGEHNEARHTSTCASSAEIITSILLSFVVLWVITPLTLSPILLCSSPPPSLPCTFAPLSQNMSAAWSWINQSVRFSEKLYDDRTPAEKWKMLSVLDPCLGEGQHWSCY